MTRLDFYLAHEAAARREAEAAPEPELVLRAKRAEARWRGLAERAQGAD